VKEVEQKGDDTKEERLKICCSRIAYVMRTLSFHDGCNEVAVSFDELICCLFFEVSSTKRGCAGCLLDNLAVSLTLAVYQLCYQIHGHSDERIYYVLDGLIYRLTIKEPDFVNRLPLTV
jgi:hypothetical protein